MLLVWYTITSPPTDTQHFFAEYLFQFWKQGLAVSNLIFLIISNCWGLGVQSIHLILSCICNIDLMEFDFQWFQHISIKQFLFSLAKPFAYYFVLNISCSRYNIDLHLVLTMVSIFGSAGMFKSWYKTDTKQLYWYIWTPFLSTNILAPTIKMKC
jgi:hypothetical protein